MLLHIVKIKKERIFSLVPQMLIFSDHMNTPLTVLWNYRSIAWLCLCLNLLPKTCLMIIIMYQLQLLSPAEAAGGKHNSGFAILHASPRSVCLSPALFLFLCWKQPHSWSTVTLWLIFRAVWFIIIGINYRIVPRWPSLFVCPCTDGSHLWISQMWLICTQTMFPSVIVLSQVIIKCRTAIM